DAGRDPRGDSGSAGSNDAARDWSLLNGKILRITTSGLPVPGNPFMWPGSERCAFRGNLPSTPATACQEIYAWGLRNPYRFDIDTDGGSGRIFANDVGQGTREEVDDIVAGGDYGWNVREGVCPRGSSPPCAGPPAGMIDPIADYGRTFGQYITGAAFAPHGRWPSQYDGAYFFGDGGSGRIFVRFADGSFDPAAPFATGAGEISDMAFGFDPLGRTALYYAVSGGGQVRRIVWTGDSPAPTPAGLTFTSAGPIRAYDTRNAIGTAAGQVRGGTSRRIQLSPPSGAVRAALVNITVTNSRGPGFVQAWTPRTRLPNTSVANVDSGGTVANSAIIALDSANTFLVHVTPTADVIVDVMGWFSDSGGGAVAAGRFQPAGPERLVDTRHPSSGSNTYSQAGDRYDMPVAGRLGVPASGASSAVVILTALGQTGVDGWAGAHAGGVAWSGTSNVNTNVPYDIRANLAIVPLGADGSISITTFRLTDVIVDVVGYITSGAAPPSTGGKYTAIAPTRVVDTRSNVGFGRLGDEQVGSIDADALVSALGGASAVAQNITLTETSEELFVTAFPTGGAVPTVSNANATGFGQIRAASAVTRLSPGNDESFFAWRDTNLIVDIVGYFTE
ncbi:MAG TPA: PQQ-dependent sugar dehydrogenase, partial [Ilumatobacteraceae bacterium]